MPDPLKLLLILLAVIAGVIDLKSSRVPNWLTLPALVAGFVLRGSLQGVPGLASAGKGLALALAIYVPLWLLRAMGAGDAKLMAAVGAITGPGDWLLIFVVSSLLGGLVGVWIAARRRVLRRTLANTVLAVGELLRFRAPWKAEPSLDVSREESMRMPHGAIIGSSVLLLFFARLF